MAPRHIAPIVILAIGAFLLGKSRNENMKYADMAITVSDLNKYMKEKIAEDEYLNNILIKGEISNFKNHYTGHMYLL